MLSKQFTVNVRMLEVIVLAAGRGTRMKSELPKVLHPIGGKPMVACVLDTARQLGAERIHVVVGHGASQVSDAVAAPDVEIYVQSEQLGTGHAALQAAPSCRADSTVLILFGDVPLLSAGVLADVVSAAETQPTLLAAMLEDPTGYGRVIRNTDGGFARVVEQKDGLPQELEVTEVNTGVLAARGSELVGWLGQVKNDNAQGEFYLPDVLSLALQDGKKVSVVVTDKSNEISGVNDRAQLEALERAHQRQKADELMAAGVHVMDASRLDIRGSLMCGSDVVLDANVLIEGEVCLGNNVVIEANCVLKDCVIGDGTVVRAFTHIEGAAVAAHCQIGPYARLRPGADLGDGAKVGNFVETKNSTLGEGSKANHFTYLGDTEVGKSTNIGAGTITCNYDGSNKHKTSIGDESFIGSNTALVAPVTIGSNATVAAGSVITKDVPDGALGVGRSKQDNKENWSKKKD